MLAWLQRIPYWKALYSSVATEALTGEISARAKKGGKYHLTKRPFTTSSHYSSIFFSSGYIKADREYRRENDDGCGDLRYAKRAEELCDT